MKVLFFANPFYKKLFEDFASSKVIPIYVTLEERIYNDLLKKGVNVVGCFEKEYDSIAGIRDIEPEYLVSSFSSDRYLNRFCYEKRLEILGKEIAFWRNIIEEYRPDFIVNETVTLEFTEVLEIEARRCGIHYYSFLSGFLPYTFYWKDNGYNSLFDSQNTAISQADITNAKDYISKIQEESLKPFYVRNLRKYSHIRNAVQIIFSQIPHHIYYSLRQWLKRGFKYIDITIETKQYLNRSIGLFFAKYDKLEWKDDIEYVFYPLHFEPEATLSYFNNPHVDQTTAIETIARALKINQVLIVKEHPQQLGALQEKKFKLIKKRNVNIKYVSGVVSSEEIIRHTSLLITLTSTAGWEAYIRKVPVIVLGDVFYKNFEGVVNANLCELKTILRGNPIPVASDDQILQSVAFMMSKMKEGAPFPYGGVSEEKRRNDFYKRIEEIAEAIKNHKQS